MLAFSLPVIFCTTGVLLSVAHPNHVPMYAHRDIFILQLKLFKGFNLFLKLKGKYNQTLKITSFKSKIASQ